LGNAELPEWLAGLDEEGTRKPLRKLRDEWFN
jgi:hypothetical protein